MKIRRLIIGGALLGVAGAVAAAAVYVMRLDRMVVTQFEGRRWTLPAQVYAAPLELYVGLPLSGNDVETELRRLAYRPATGDVRTGTYRRVGEEIDVGLRATRFADEARPAGLLSITTQDGAITALRDGTGRALPILRLDPLLIGSIFPIHGEDRIIVTPAEVPPLLPAALKAVEDRNFDTNRGVNVLGILRALWVDIRAGRWDQGGSTLTQQLARSYFLSPERTASRKIREAIMAIALDGHFGKADLMNAYINEIHLGQDGDRAINGFGLASEFYFGKPLSELDLREIATLVALVRGPSYYDPRRHPDRALKHRNLVLDELVEQHVVSLSDARLAEAQPLGITAKTAGAYYPAYLDLVRRTLRSDYREQDLTEAGLKVFTNLDPRIEADAERVLDRELERLERTHHRAGSDAPLEGAVVVTEPQSGDVIAVVGGRDSSYDGFNRALDGRRQIGSLVKPFVYLAALEHGVRPSDVFNDHRVRIGNWEPHNFENKYLGDVTVSEAIAESLNSVAAQVIERVGVDNVIEAAHRLGIASNLTRDDTLALGTSSVTLLDLTTAYCAFASGGVGAWPYGITEIRDPKGNVLWRRTGAGPGRVIDSGIAGEMNGMLMGVIQHGTGRAAQLDRPAAGKTGTTEDFRDALFMGFTADLVTGVWFGNDDNAPMKNVTGGTLPARTWKTFMVQATQGMPVRPLPLGEEAPRIASAAGAPQQQSGGLLGGLQSLLRSIFGGDAASAAQH